MVMVNNILKMEIHMMEILLIINLVVKGLIVGKVERNILESLKMEKEMGMAFGNQHKIILIFTKANIWMIEKVVLVYTNGQMDLFMRETLKMI